MSVTIRNFGNNIEVNSNNELIESLKAYAGDSVSIQYTKPSGIKNCLLVDVSLSDDALSIKDSHSGAAIGDFNHLFH
ncbi:hypothetical protein LMH73_023830 [Vibrio splendidus]|nr:hypothetical protein [Vibrio splendidus]MCC4883083.1 hypothetical protein [Vibrio splendidus]